MRILCLTRDPELIRQVANIFSDHIAQIDHCETPQQFLAASSAKTWNIFFIDFDAVEASFGSPVDLLGRLGPGRKILATGSSSFTAWHTALKKYGAVVLHKPTSAGEVGLALRRLHSNPQSE